MPIWQYMLRSFLFYFYLVRCYKVPGYFFLFLVMIGDAETEL